MNHRRSLLFAASILTLSSTARATVSERMFIDSFLTVPSSVMTDIGRVLPESTAVGSAFLSKTYDPNFVVTSNAKVMVTFLHEGAGYRNSLGYFTYRVEGTSIQIIDSQLVFPNASYADPNKGWGGGTLSSGDTVTLRDAAGNQRLFLPGERIGFFLIANGWNAGTVSGWGSLTIPASTPADNGGPANGTYTSIDELNPEVSVNRSDVARHTAVVRMTGRTDFLGGADFYVMGMEDQRRSGGSDNDFNDCVFLIQSTPETALSTSNVLVVNDPTADTDGDGVPGLQDYFPNDPTRAFIIATPSTGYQTLAFEDQYPSVGDADFNDAVIQTSYEQVQSANGLLRRLVATHHLIARGAGYDHAFGLALHGSGVAPQGTLRIERFASGASSSTIESVPWSSVVTESADGTWTLRYDGVFASTRTALPSPTSGSVTNTQTPALTVPPASARLVVDFQTDVSAVSLGGVPFDPYLLVHRSDGDYDIHRPGMTSFSDRPSSLPIETGTHSFVDANNFPWLLQIANDWRFPLETVRIADGTSSAPYPAFDLWRLSGGTSSRDWYLTTTQPTRVTNAFGTESRARNWQILASQL